MAGLTGRAAAALLTLTAASPAADGVAKAGRILYDYGDPSAVLTPGMTAACAACHGDFAEGGSEGGIAAPALTSLAAMEDEQAYALLTAALREGRDRDGRRQLVAMPRYGYSDHQVRQVMAYLRTGLHARATGVEATTIAIALDLDTTSLAAAQRHAILSAVEAQFESVHKAGGIHGRRIVLVPVGDAALLRIVWEAPASTHGETVGFRGASTGSEQCPACCGSLHPPPADQIAAVERWHAENSPGAGMVVEADGPPPAQRIPDFVRYGLADGAVRGPFGGDYRLVLAYDIDARRAEIADATSAGTSLAARNVQVEAGEIVSAIVGTLLSQGRRLSARRVCRGLDQALKQSAVLSIVDMKTDVVVTNRFPVYAGN